LSGAGAIVMALTISVVASSLLIKRMGADTGVTRVMLKATKAHEITGKLLVTEPVHDGGTERLVEV
jgi:hypothetical protein